MTKYIQIIGERHTGSKWVKKLLNKSFKNIQVSDWEKHWFVNEYKLKNFLESGERSPEHMKNKAKEDNLDYEIFNNLYDNNIIVIVLTRFVWDWLIAMKKDPHHCENKKELVLNTSLSDFLKWNWKNNRDETKFSWPVENVIHLRYQKYKNWIKYFSSFNKIDYIRYEDMLIDAVNIINFFKQKYDLEYKDNNIPIHINKNKIDKSIYYNRNNIWKYYKQKDIEFVNKYIDDDIENYLGYFDYEML